MTGGGAAAVDTEAWDTPPRQGRAPHASPTLSVDGFEGPLDWLLEMARARKVDLAKLSILELVTAFETALQVAIAAGRGEKVPAAAPARTIAVWGDWLVVAAELTLLRSHLLAASVEDAKVAAQQAEVLRRRLLDRAAVVAGADWLDGRVQLGRDVFARGLPETDHRVGRVGDVVGLLRACLVALALPDNADAAFPMLALPFWTVAQAIARIRDFLPELGAEGGDLWECLPVVAADAPERAQRCRAAVVGTFAAGLELAREGTVALSQDSWSDAIVVSEVAQSSVGVKTALNTAIKSAI